MSVRLEPGAHGSTSGSARPRAPEFARLAATSVRRTGVTEPLSRAQRAEALLRRLGLTYDHVLGLRFAVNVFIATIIVWQTLAYFGNDKPIWAIASMVASSEPDPDEARRLLRSRVINVLVGCGVGFVFLWLGGGRAWTLPLALATTVLVSTWFVRVKTMWRQAPITAAIVIAAALSSQSTLHGFEQGLLKVGQVLFGSIVGMAVSWTTARFWIMKRPADHDPAA
jgi:uncharacterized membrane protein YccC